MKTHERVPLAEFLAGLNEAAAAEARVAASRIDELARADPGLEDVERQYLPFLLLAGLAFIAGIVLFLSPGMAPRPVTVICLAALPAVLIAYGRRVMSRTRADQAAEDLNIRHFLPHGGLYFAAGAQPACVVRVPPQRDVIRTPDTAPTPIWVLGRRRR